MKKLFLAIILICFLGATAWAMHPYFVLAVGGGEKVPAHRSMLILMWYGHGMEITKIHRPSPKNASVSDTPWPTNSMAQTRRAAPMPTSTPRRSDAARNAVCPLARSAERMREMTVAITT